MGIVETIEVLNEFKDNVMRHERDRIERAVFNIQGTYTLPEDAVGLLEALYREEPEKGGESKVS